MMSSRMRESYRRRRDLVVAGLSAIPGLKLAPIPATFYAFPDVGGFLGRSRQPHAATASTASATGSWRHMA